MGGDVEGSDGGRIKGTVQEFVWREWEDHEKNDIFGVGRESNKVPLEYEPEAYGCS